MSILLKASRILYLSNKNSFVKKERDIKETRLWLRGARTTLDDQVTPHYDVMLSYTSNNDLLAIILLRMLFS